MIRYLLAAAAATMLVAACIPASNDDIAAGVPSAGPPAARVIVKAAATRSSAAEIPAEIIFASSVGQVIFTHQAHLRDRAIGCVECHHQINARPLTTPHPDYLKSSWVNCKVCHDGSGKTRQQVYTCSECHHSNPVDLVDETLSSKVVVHKQCWKCHPVSTGKEASSGCEKCHSGPKTM